ncbi:hypothetical protein [Taibaiella soli]|uniref:DUF4625 domain-containing protein n=1 Tax=Taibaiella soli TaxID=1649169 RepID=A0A2W2BMY8_9BACT|nr:hypothetical protein [Taibaiella soli]PZF74826.1 hypothetical protein DN068_01110 [Taibaiella soli]
MTRLLIAAALGILCFTACKKSDDNTSHAPAITGINMRNINAQPMGPMGTPNVLTSLNGNEILCYPNPCSDLLMTEIHGTNGTTAKIWLVAAAYSNHPDTIPYTKAVVKVENQSLYGQPNPVVDKIVTLTGTTYTNVEVRTDSLPNGFYKLYTVIGTDTLYDNICVYR